MTVDQLELEMLAARQRYTDANDQVRAPIDPEARDRLAGLLATAHFARDTWEIARDLRLSAALMFKLSAGNADPRYPGPPESHAPR